MTHHELFAIQELQDQLDKELSSSFINQVAVWRLRHKLNDAMKTCDHRMPDGTTAFDWFFSSRRFKCKICYESHQGQRHRA